MKKLQERGLKFVTNDFNRSYEEPLLQQIVIQCFFMEVA